MSAKTTFGVERGTAHAHAQDVTQHHARQQHLRNYFVVELGRLQRVCQYVDGVDLVQSIDEQCEEEGKVREEVAEVVGHLPECYKMLQNVCWASCMQHTMIQFMLKEPVRAL